LRFGFDSEKLITKQHHRCCDIGTWKVVAVGRGLREQLRAVALVCVNGASHTEQPLLRLTNYPHHLMTMIPHRQSSSSVLALVVVVS
jgi:hypothetical protein